MSFQLSISELLDSSFFSLHIVHFPLAQYLATLNICCHVRHAGGIGCVHINGNGQRQSPASTVSMQLHQRLPVCLVQAHGFIVNAGAIFGKRLILRS